MRLLFILACAVFLGSCDGSTNREFFLVNGTDQDLRLHVQGMQDSTYTLGPGQSQMVAQGWQLGGNSNPGEPGWHLTGLRAEQGIQSASLSWETGEGWAIESDQLSRLPSSWHHRFTLVVKPEDF